MIPKPGKWKSAGNPLIDSEAGFHLAVKESHSVNFEPGVLVGLAFGKQACFLKAQEAPQAKAILQPDLALMSQRQSQGFA